MKVLVYMILGIMAPCTAMSKCSTLLMCPSFCMKVKYGCYVCDCGMFSNYLQQAAENMAAISNNQHSQTGTLLSSRTSGYNTVDSNTDVQSSLNDQSTQQYINMMQMAFQYMNLQPYKTKPMQPQMPAQDYKGFEHNYNVMPGMSCTPVDERCPSPCWTTDVYTGCLHCGCALATDGHAFKQQYHTTERPVATTIESPIIPFYEYVQSEHTDTPHPEINQTQTNAVVNISKPSTFGRLSTPAVLSNPTSSSPKLIFPTKPPKTVIVSSERMVSAQYPDDINTTDSMSVIGNNFSLAVPTTLGEMDSFQTTFSYAVPTPLPSTNKPSPLISVLKSSISSTKNKTNNKKAHKMSQTKSKTKEQTHDSVTTPSRKINNQRYFASITIKEKNAEENVQSTIIRKLEQPLKPQITFRTSAVKTSTGNASAIPMHLSLANTGRENHSLDNSTSGGRNYYGFYLHAETG